MATRIGVDVGGTFTDLIFYDDESGEVRVAKEPTTTSSPEEGVVDLGGVEAAPQLGARPGEEGAVRADPEAVSVEQRQGEQEVILGRPPPGWRA